MAKKIQTSFFKYQQLKRLRKLFKAIKRIQVLFKVKNEYKKFKNTQKMIRKIQAFQKHVIFKKKINEMFEQNKAKKVLATKLSSIFKKNREKNRFKNIRTAAFKINKVYRGFLGRKIAKKMRTGNFIMDICFDRAWKIILKKIQTKAAIIIQKYFRLFLVKIKFKEIIAKIKAKK